MDKALSYAAVFVMMVLTDFVWAKYTIAVSDKRPAMGGFWSMCIILAGSYVTRAYVADAWMVLPTALGAFVGTFIATKWAQRGDTT